MHLEEALEAVEEALDAHGAEALAVLGYAQDEVKAIIEKIREIVQNVE